MPIKIPDKLPAKKILEKEHFFVIDRHKAIHQDIRPLKIAIVNLMPKKIETETQLIRILSNSPLQIELDLIHMASYESVNTNKAHFKAFYKTFSKIKNQRFDGLIITGAPVEHLAFEEVDYWDELTEIMKWAEKNVTSTLFLCWAAQAGLQFHYGVKKYKKDKKIFGIFPHHIVQTTAPLLRGFDENFLVPHSRHTETRKKDIEKIPELELLAESIDAGMHIIASKDGRKIFIFGHPEYDRSNLQSEYERDIKKGVPIELPKNYFPNNDPTKSPIVTWKSNGFLLYSNWLNYYVYQTTPYTWIKRKAANS